MIKRVSKHIFYIFIYILSYGCSDLITGIPFECPDCPIEQQEEIMDCDECWLDISAPSLEIDENGYYHMQVLSGYNQTFTTLEATTGLSGNHNLVKVGWGTDAYILYEWNGVIDTITAVNGATYTGSDGIANTVFSAWPEFVGDTVLVGAAYMDGCFNEHFDYLNIIIED